MSAGAKTFSELVADEEFELAYCRRTYDDMNQFHEQTVADMGKRMAELVFELDDLKRARSPDFVADLVVERLLKHVDQRVDAMLRTVFEGVQATLLPRLERVTNASATLPDLERRQIEIEAQLRVLKAAG